MVDEDETKKVGTTKSEMSGTPRKKPPWKNSVWEVNLYCTKLLKIKSTTSVCVFSPNRFKIAKVQAEQQIVNRTEISRKKNRHNESAYTFLLSNKKKSINWVTNSSEWGLLFTPRRTNSTIVNGEIPETKSIKEKRANKNTQRVAEVTTNLSFKGSRHQMAATVDSSIISLAHISKKKNSPSYQTLTKHVVCPGMTLKLTPLNSSVLDRMAESQERLRMEREAAVKNSISTQLKIKVGIKPKTYVFDCPGMTFKLTPLDASVRIGLRTSRSATKMNMGRLAKSGMVAKGRSQESGTRSKSSCPGKTLKLIPLTLSVEVGSEGPDSITRKNGDF